MRRLSSVLLGLLALPLAASQGAGDAAVAERDEPDAEPVAFCRVDSPPAPLLQQGNVWDLPTQAARPRAARFAVGKDGSLLLRKNAALALQIPGRALGRLRLTLQGTVKGAPAQVHLLSMLVPINDVDTVDAIPSDMKPRIHETLAELAWAPGAPSVVTPLCAGDRATTWLLLSVETGADGELALDHVRLEEHVPAAPDRHGIGAETRPSAPLATGSTRRFELPPLPAGARIELALSPPEGMARLRAPLTVRCRLEGDGESEQVVTFVDPPAGLDGRTPVRRWRDLVVAVDRARERAGRLEVVADGPAGAAVFVALPIVAPRRDATTPSNVLLISIDTLRADRVGAWGATSGATPALDAFARRCVRFARAYSPANFTIPAHASMMTGLEPLVHGAYRYGERRSIRASPNLAGACAQAGMLTAAFTGGGLVDAVFGFDRNFARYQMLDPLMTERNPRYLRSPRKQMPDYNRALRQDVSLAGVTGWLEQHADRRFFLFFHTYHAHDYAPADESVRRFGGDPAARWPKPVDLDPAEFGTIARDSPQICHYSHVYDASVSEVDAAFAALLATLERGGLLDHTVVLVTADHGEGFKEHGFLFHATGLNDEVLHVPLLLYAPGFAPTVVDTPVSLIDVAPTLIELAGLQPLPDTQGRSLVPLLRGQEPDELGSRPLLAQDSPSDGLTHCALVSGRFKYVRVMKRAAPPAPHAPGQPHDVEQLLAAEHLYDLLADPREQHDLAAEPVHATTLAHAREALDRKLAETKRAAAQAAARRDERVETGADLDEELRALGYGGS